MIYKFKSMSTFKKGDKVSWKWGNGMAHGQIKSLFNKKTTRKIKGTEVVKNGSAENPALYIVLEDNARALKLSSEVEKQ